MYHRANISLEGRYQFKSTQQRQRYNSNLISYQQISPDQILYTLFILNINTRLAFQVSSSPIMTQPQPALLLQQPPQLQSQLLKQILKTRIENQFNRIPSSKCLYAHKEILTTINFTFDFKFQTTSMSGKIYQFIDDPKAIDTDPASNVLFFIYAKPQSMSTIASIILHNQASFVKKKYFLYFVPVVDYLCEEELKRMGVWDKVNIKKLDFNFIPFTQKLLSLQLPPHLTSIEQQSCIVQGVLKLQFMRGGFKNIIGKGRTSKSMLQHLQRRRKEISQIEQREEDNDILVVMDRRVDMVTPLLSGLSYECLLDYFFGINMNRIDIPGVLFGSDKKVETFLLNNKKDPVYEEISFMNINDVPTYLKQRSQKLKELIQQQKEKATDYQELNKLNNTLMVEYLLIQNHQSLVLHILEQMKSIQFNNSLILQSSILQGEQAQTPFKYEDVEYLSLFYPLQHLIRILCLHSQCSDQSRYYTKNEKYILQFLLNIERIDHLPSLYNLVKGEVLREAKFKNSWKEIADKFILFPQEDQTDPYTNLNIIYSAFTVKILQLIIKNKLDPEKSALVSKDTYFRGTIPKFTKIQNVYLLMVGGISYNEISCIKQLANKIHKNIQVLTTDILGQNQLIKKFLFTPTGL